MKLDLNKYYNKLGTLQNLPCNVYTDIMSDEEKITHLKRYASKTLDALEVINLIKSVNHEIIGE